MTEKVLPLFESVSNFPLVWVIFIVVCLWLSNYAIQFLIKHCIGKMVRHQDAGSSNHQPRIDKLFEGVVQAGVWTGVLERTIVLILVLIGEFSAMAWIMAAKGFILQTASKQNHVADHDALIRQETYLIGTFASFAVAIIGGLLMRLWIE